MKTDPLNEFAEHFELLTLREKELVVFHCRNGHYEKAKEVLRNVFTYYKNIDRNKSQLIVDASGKLGLFEKVHDEPVGIDTISNVWDAANDAINYGHSLFPCASREEAERLRDEVMGDEQYGMILDCLIIREKELNFIRILQ